MKYHQTNQNEIAIYLLIPWEWESGGKNTDVITSPATELTYEWAGVVYDWGKYYQQHPLIAGLNF